MAACAFYARRGLEQQRVFQRKKTPSNSSCPHGRQHALELAQNKIFRNHLQKEAKHHKHSFSVGTYILGNAHNCLGQLMKQWFEF